NLVAVQQYPDPYLWDTFTGTNGTSLASHTMNAGGGWTIDSGTWQIQSNAASKTNSASANQIATADAGHSDLTVSADVTLGSSGPWTAGLALGFVDANNHLQLVLGGSGLQRVDLFEYSGGTYTNRGYVNSPVSLANGGTYTLKAVLSGSTITVYLNGQL